MVYSMEFRRAVAIDKKERQGNTMVSPVISLLASVAAIAPDANHDRSSGSCLSFSLKTPPILLIFSTQL
jgi:hypothetical protein